MENINHTFAISAYKESPYLEECIQSLVSQKIKSKIIVCTSTPCEYIENIAKKYSLPYYIKTTKSDIQDDWNFAYNKADTDWVTVAHQDDIYNEEYSKVILETAKKYDDINMIYTDYMPILNGKTGKRDKNSKIKKVLRCPLLIPGFNKIKFVKKMTLALGNTICCPTVTYNKKRVGDTIFTSELKFSLDWDTFYKFACMKGRTVYINKPYAYYRIHDGATTKTFIVNDTRKYDDIYMFNKFWPKWITNLIMKVYVKAYDTYN